MVITEKDKYLHGECELFAIALYLIYPVDIYAIYEIRSILENGELKQRKGLVHAYCYSNRNNMFIDARGIISIEDIEDEYLIDEMSCVSIEKITNISDLLIFIHGESTSSAINKITEETVPYIKENLSSEIDKYLNPYL